MAIQHTSGADQTLTLSEGQQNQLSFSAADIRDMHLGEHGSLIIGLKDGHTVTIANFHALAGDAAKLALADGTALDARAIEEILAKDTAVTIAPPMPSLSMNFSPARNTISRSTPPTPAEPSRKKTARLSLRSATTARSFSGISTPP
jgi:hypothetical protein